MRQPFHVRPVFESESKSNEVAEQSILSCKASASISSHERLKSTSNASRRESIQVTFFQLGRTRYLCLFVSNAIVFIHASRKSIFVIYAALAFSDIPPSGVLERN